MQHRRPSDTQEEGMVALEGALLVERAIAAGLEIEELYCVPARETWALALRDADAQNTVPNPVVIAEAKIADIAGYNFHRGAYALARRPAVHTIEECCSKLNSLTRQRDTVLILPEISDPENLGAAFRNAAALGCSALFIGTKGPDPLSRRVLRVSMGSSLTLPWARLQAPAELVSLDRRGYVLAACVLDESACAPSSWKRPERLGLMLGNEAFGLSLPWLETCSRRITIPMLGGIDSLNVATAAAVFLYALSAGSDLRKRTGASLSDDEEDSRPRSKFHEDETARK